MFSYVNLSEAQNRYDGFAKGAQIYKQSEKSLGSERTKLGISIILILGALSALILTPYIQKHTFTDFGNNLLNGLKEAKWAILAGGVMALAAGTLFGLYLWRKNKEEKNQAEFELISDIEGELPKEDQLIVEAKNEELSNKDKEVTVNQSVIAIAILSAVVLGLIAFGSLQQQVWSLNDVAQIKLTDVIIAGAVSGAIMGIAYAIFKNRELNEIKVAKKVVTDVKNNYSENLGGGYDFGITLFQKSLTV